MTTLTDTTPRQAYKQAQGGDQLITLIKKAGEEKPDMTALAQIEHLATQYRLNHLDKTCLQGYLNILDLPGKSDDVWAKKIAEYIEDTYALSGPHARLNLKQAYQDPLLLKALKTVLLCHPLTEKLIVTLREAVLVTTYQSQAVDDQSVNMIVSLAHQSYLNEYATHINSSEQTLLAQFESALAQAVFAEHWMPSHSEAILLILCMYKPLHESPLADRFLQAPLTQWPSNLTALAEKTLFDPQKEKAMAETITSLRPIENSTSLRVRAQYEANPYPRWQCVYATPMKSLFDFIVFFCPWMTSKLPNRYQQDGLNILVAGCGTGRHAISVAMRFPASQITAVDLSKRSLAYGKIKAQTVGVQNIDFLHGDILNLNDHLSSFDYIECSGVLHHMENPLDGWLALKNRLKPGGLMKIALYSQIARREISLFRQSLKQDQEVSHDLIRETRKRILEMDVIPGFAQGGQDFYNTSTCRDLLFHTQEKNYSWPEIQDCLNALAIDFVGLVNTNNDIAERYAEKFGSGRCVQDLEKLDQFEKALPWIFSGMYQFFCQKPFGAEAPT